MARTFRHRSPKLLNAIRRNRHTDTTVHAWRDPNSKYGRHDLAVLRGQDGAIPGDKCQTATIDGEGGYRLNNHDYIYSKNRVSEPDKKRRSAGKILIRRALEG